MMMLPWDKFKESHRCAVSLRQGVPIRYIDNLEYAVFGVGWYIIDVDHDLDYDCHHLRKVARIKYCPFCGNQLDETI